MRDKVTRQCPQTTTFEEKGEPKRIRTELALTPYLPLGQTGSQLSTISLPCCVERRAASLRAAAASNCLFFFKSWSSGIRRSLYGGAHELSFFSEDLGSKQGKLSRLRSASLGPSYSRSPRSLHHYLAHFVAPWPSCVRVCVHPCCMG